MCGGKQEEEENPDTKYGKPAEFDPSFNGPIKKRGCTDIICCILFIIVILGYLAVGAVAWLYGDPRHVLYPKNSTGWFCGIGANKDRPYLFYFDILKCATSVNVIATALNGIQCPTTQVKKAAGASLVFTRDLVNGFNAKEIGVRIFEDFASSWPWILIVLIFIFSAGIWHCYWEYDNFKNLSASINDIGFTTNFSVYLEVQETWLAILIIISVVEAILLLTLIFLRTRILIAIALIQEASKTISYMMSALAFPLITFVLLLVCVAYWGTTALYLATSGDPVYKVVALNSTMSSCQGINGTNFSADAYPNCPSASCIFIKYNDEGLLQRSLFNLQIFNAIAFLWCANFVIALGQCTLAGAFASYYWAFRKPQDIPMFPVCAAFLRTLRYHVGSLAFGALILTLVQIVRVILEYIDHKTKSSQNAVARFIMCCLKCCFWCLEKFVKFLNRNAYIMIAIYGKNFCVSAKKAFMLLLRNAIRVVVLDKVTDLLLFFGKLLVVGGVGVLSFFFFSGRIHLPDSNFSSESLNYYWMPIIVVVIGSYLIAHAFFSVYSMCVDTLFLCFLEDLERNDGSQQKPYLMSKSLRKILNKSNESPKQRKRNN
uniref:Choline transporter-like protein n=1 Tax=Salarias fasciatus TaxID=181472 RepID=A0A672I149_SALFA